jgi:hypothetical protein
MSSVLLGSSKTTVVLGQARSSSTSTAGLSLEAHRGREQDNMGLFLSAGRDASGARRGLGSKGWASGPVADRPVTLPYAGIRDL